MAKGKYYTPEFKEQAVKIVVGLDCTCDLLHALQGQCFRLDANPDRSRSARPRRGQTPGMTAAGSRPSRTGRIAAPDCLTHVCHHVHAADQRDLHLARGAGAAGTGGPGGQVLLREPVRIRGVAGVGPERAANAGRGRCLVRAARRRARHS